MTDLWHAYSAVDDEEYILLIVGPIAEGEDRADGQGWEDGYLTTGPNSEQAMLFDFISSFDHEPTDDERYFLVPDEYRALYLRAIADEDEAEFTKEERTALSLAIQFRVPQLEEVINHYQAGISFSGVYDRKVAQACQDQIDALFRIASKLDLDLETWEV